VLRVSINSIEFQDVAVIQVSRNNAGNVIVQIIGDEALYGRDYVVEPSMRSVIETPNLAYIGDHKIIINNNAYGNGIIYVSDWPIIAFLFSPSFSIYVSPWHRGYYPVYWNPWRPILYFNYWSYHNHYLNSPRYHRKSYIRFASHHSYYLRRRTSSSIVTRNRSAGTYRSTYGARDFRRPVEPPRVSRRDIRRENRESTRQENIQSTRGRVQPSIRLEGRIPKRPQNRPLTIQGDRKSSRQKAQPFTAPQNRQSTTEQLRTSSGQAAPSTTRQTDRQVRQAARQSGRDGRQSNRDDRKRNRP
jgi:hypothetical protein